MGLSRRRFTEEFRLAAVRRLQRGVPLPAAAQAWEASSGVLQRERLRFRRRRTTPSPATARRAGARAASPRLSARPASGLRRPAF